MLSRCHAAERAHRRPRLLRQLFLAAALTSTAACGSSHMEPAATLADAQTTAAKLIRDAAAAVFPPGYTLQPLTPLPLNCTDFLDRPTGRTEVGVTFWINDVPTTHNDDYFDALHRWWIQHGWASTTDSRPTDMFTNAINGDGYLMSLTANVKARLALGATTPCLPTDGTHPRAPPQPIPPASPRLTAATTTPRPPESPSRDPTLHCWPAARTAQLDLPDHHR